MIYKLLTYYLRMRLLQVILGRFSKSKHGKNNFLSYIVEYLLVSLFKVKKKPGKTSPK